MNTVPDSFIRVMPDPLQRFVKSTFLKTGMPEADASLLAEALVAGDLRGVFSHGSQQVGSYVPQLLEGDLNPRPTPTVVRESPTSVTIDGDGGLGYFPSFKAIHMAVQKAKETGMAVGMTSNHGHFGSAGHYTRVAVEAGCFGMAVSSHYRDFPSERSILGASGASPISMGVPAGDQPPLIIDMASGAGAPDTLFKDIPGTFFKMLGFGLVCNALGGILSGMVTQEESGPKTWKGVNQGAFFIVVDINQLTEIDTFHRQMDDFIGALRNMQPAPGFDTAETPGGLEAEREKTWRKEGIPIGDHHQGVLKKVAKMQDLTVPWQ